MCFPFFFLYQLNNYYSVYFFIIKKKKKLTDNHEWYKYHEKDETQILLLALRGPGPPLIFEGPQNQDSDPKKSNMGLGQYLIILRAQSL